VRKHFIGRWAERANKSKKGAVDQAPQTRQPIDKPLMVRPELSKTRIEHVKRDIEESGEAK